MSDHGCNENKENLTSPLKFIKIVQETFKLLLPISGMLWFLCVILIAGSLWQYLVLIDAKDLFFQSVISIQGLTALFIVTVLFVLVILISICSPSLLTFLIASGEVFENNKPPKQIVYPYIITPILTLLAFWILIYLEVYEAWIVFAVTVVTILAFLFLRNKYIYNILNNAITRKDNWFVIVVYLFFSSMYSLLILASINPFWKYTLKIWTDIIPISFCIILGYVPGLLYILSRSDDTSLKQGLYKLFFTIAFIIVLIFAISPIKIRTSVFKATGVYSKTSSKYQLIKSELTQSLIASKLISEKKEDLEQFRVNLIFTAYTRYNFGGIRLLCKAPFDPDDIESNINDTGCIAFEDDEIKRIYLPSRKESS